MFDYYVYISLEGLREDWSYQLSHPFKIKSLLTYLHTYLQAKDPTMSTSSYPELSEKLPLVDFKFFCSSKSKVNNDDIKLHSL